MDTALPKGVDLFPGGEILKELHCGGHRSESTVYLSSVRSYATLLRRSLHDTWRTDVPDSLRCCDPPQCGAILCDAGFLFGILLPMLLNLLLEQPALFLVILLVIVVALSFHEFAHAYVGYRLGDSTAQQLGRLTLNPLAHVDWVGLLFLVTVGFGWGKPVPFNPHNLKFQKWGPVMVALAGPASNLLLALIASIAFWILTPAGLGSDNGLMLFLIFSVIINLGLMFFNLIPLPPLDGSKLLGVILNKPQHAALRYRLETQGFWILVIIIALDAVLDIGLFSWLFSTVMALANVLLGV